MTTQTMPKAQYDEIFKEIIEFVDKYTQDNVDNNANVIITTFETNHNRWFQIVPYMKDCKEYAGALMLYCTAIDKQPTYESLQKLSSYISEFESYNLAHHAYRKDLYYSLGITWHHLGRIYDTFAIDAFKKYIFYLLGMSSHTAYSPICYSFRKCTTYLYQSLTLEQLNLSSPCTFNDPFDSPIVSLLDKNDEIAMLIRTAYLDCVKIACFVSNVMLPFQKDGKISGEIVQNKRKQEDNTSEEFQNELMWAHYADYHRGICIKYHFPNSLTSLYSEPGTSVKYFRDVQYKDDLSVLTEKDSITIEDAFFAKSKAWKYENELRLILCNPNSSGLYDSIDIPNCIEAIYFGVNCANKDIKVIREIMKNREFVTKQERIVDNKHETIETRTPVSFYQMEFDSKKFGSLIAKKLQ